MAKFLLDLMENNLELKMGLGPATIVVFKSVVKHRISKLIAINSCI